MTGIANNILFFKTSTYELIWPFICISGESCHSRNNRMTFYTLHSRHSSFSEAIGEEEDESRAYEIREMLALVPHGLCLLGRTEMAPVNSTHGLQVLHVLMSLWNESQPQSEVMGAEEQHHSEPWETGTRPEPGTRDEQVSVTTQLRPKRTNSWGSSLFLRH